MVETAVSNYFILGGLSGLIGVAILYLHFKNTPVNEDTRDDKVYIKMFILISVLSCLSVFINQNYFNVSKLTKSVSGGGVSIHTGSPTF